MIYLLSACAQSQDALWGAMKWNWNARSIQISNEEWLVLEAELSYQSTHYQHSGSGSFLAQEHQMCRFQCYSRVLETLPREALDNYNINI